MAVTSFTDFMKTRQATVPTVAEVTSTSKAGITSFEDFMKTKGAAPTSIGGQAWDITKKVAGPPLRWAGKQLMKPVSTIAVTAENIYQAAQGDVSQIANIPKDAWGILSGKKERSFTDIALENIKNPVVATGVGLTADILLDPTTYLSFGLTAQGKIASRVAKILAAGGRIEKGSKLAKDIEKTGKTAEELVGMLQKTDKAGVIRDATKAEQSLTGARAFAKIGGKPIFSPSTSAKLYQSTAKAGEAIKALPVIGAGIEKGRSLFQTSTGIPGADRLLTQARSTNDYLAMKGIDEAVATEKQMVKAGISKQLMIQVANYLEKGKIPENTILRDIAMRHKGLYKELFVRAQKAGIDVGKHSFYYPHVEKKAPKSILEKTEGFLSSKKYTTKTGAVEPRDVMKFQNQSGSELIGTPKQLGMTPLPNVKGLSHDLTWGTFNSIKQIEDVLKTYGVGLVFNPQPWVKRNGVVGYFDPRGKNIVIASARHTLQEVMQTLKHEITHSAHFQIAGNIAMYEEFAKMGHAAPMFKALEAAKSAVREEWKNILAVVENINPVKFATLKPNHKKYLTSPTELLARVGDYMSRGPSYAEIAMEMFPKSVEAFALMKKANPTFKLLDTSIADEGARIVGEVYRHKDTNQLFQSLPYGIEKAGVQEINRAFGSEFFHENPAIAYAYRATANAKAVASAELFQGIKQFAVAAGEQGVQVKVPELKGLFFPPSLARKLDEYHKMMQPEEIGATIRGFDAIQNWWKGQALISPGYHSRNAIGNWWNNSLAGVGYGAKPYIDAWKVQNGKLFSFVDDAGKKWDSAAILDAAQKTGAVNRGQYLADIPQAIEGQVKSATYNPLSQQNILFRGNRFVGGAIENNARLANFIHQLKKGLPPVDAAMEVKKYLFDYGDLTSFEQNILKRIMPFYTFTRKNLPLQLDSLATKPGKYANLEKIVGAIEDIGMSGQPQPDEKYLSDYIKSNTSMRVKYNPKDKSYSYFLLGNWLPAYQMMDFLATPPDSIWQLVTPILKTPIDFSSNKSSFWKDSLGEYQQIERYPGEQVNFLGINMPKKTALIFSNITMLNNLDKLNPGQVFGGTPGTPSIFGKVGKGAFEIPGLGNISPAQYKYNPSTTSVPSELDRWLAFGTGKLTTYKPSISREYYNRETDIRVSEYKTAITKAQRSKDNERAKLLQAQLIAFQKMRGR